MVEIVNAGGGTGSPFVVEINGQYRSHPPLVAGKGGLTWVPGYDSVENSVAVDVGAQVQEIDRENNQLRGPLAVPTRWLLPTCPPPATATPGPRPDLAIESVRRALSPYWWWCDPDQEHGLQVEFANHGAESSGTFIVEANGAPLAALGLAPGESASRWYPQEAVGEQHVVIDSADEVLESDETNNEFVGVPVQATAPSCAPTATATATGMATASATPTGSATPPTPTGTDEPATVYLPSAERR